MPEGDDLNVPILALSLLTDHCAGLTADDVGQAWPVNLPANRVLTAERAASRNLLDAQPVPSTATPHDPFRTWIGALDPEHGDVHWVHVRNSAATIAYGWIAPLAERAQR